MKVVKVLVKEVHFSPLLVKVRDSLVKVLLESFVRIHREGGKRVREASIYASKKISLKFLFLSDIFLFPPIRQQVPILA